MYRERERGRLLHPFLRAACIGMPRSLHASQKQPSELGDQGICTYIHIYV